MITALSFAAAFCALAAIAAELAAEWNGRRHPAFYLLKPLTTLLIIGIAGCGDAGDYRTLVLVALTLSLVGDMCLMFAADGWFVGGLGSFLLAHIVFVIAFAHGLPTLMPPLWSAVFLIYGLGFFGWLLPRTGPLLAPVVVYGIALLGMALVASARDQALHNTSTLYALAGAALFVISDSCLAVRKFRGPYRHAQALILSTYWMSIGLIAWSTTATTGT